MDALLLHWREVDVMVYILNGGKREDEGMSLASALGHGQERRHEAEAEAQTEAEERHKGIEHRYTTFPLHRYGECSCFWAASKAQRFEEHAHRNMLLTFGVRYPAENILPWYEVEGVCFLP